MPFIVSRSKPSLSESATAKCIEFADREPQSEAMAASMRFMVEVLRGDRVISAFSHVLVFYGGSGTGKTALSQRLEDWIRGDVADDVWGGSASERQRGDRSVGPEQLPRGHRHRLVVVELPCGATPDPRWVEVLRHGFVELFQCGAPGREPGPHVVKRDPTHGLDWSIRRDRQRRRFPASLNLSSGGVGSL